MTTDGIGVHCPRNVLRLADGLRTAPRVSDDSAGCAVIIIRDALKFEELEQMAVRMFG